MFKSSLLVAFTLFLYLSAECQQTNKELSFAVYRNGSDTTKLRWLLTHGKTFEANNFDSAVYYYTKATALAFSLKNVHLFISSMQQHTSFLNNEAKFEEALALAQQHAVMADQLNNATVKMLAYNEEANEYEYLGSYESATEYYFKSLMLAESTGDKKMQRKINNNLGSVFLALKDYATGYTYSSRACEMAREVKDSVTVANCLVNMSVAELNQKKYEQALHHLDEAAKIGYSTRDMTLVADALSDKGLVYLSMHNLNAAAASYQKQKSIADEYNLPYEKMYSLFQMALVQKERRQYKNADGYAAHAIAIGEKVGTADELMEMYDSMSVIKQQLGDYKSALYYKNRYAAINDSLLNQRVQTNIHNLNIQYRTAQKNKRIAEQNLSIEKSKTAIERKNIWILISVGATVAVIMIWILSLRSYRHKQILYRQRLITMEKQYEVDRLKTTMQAKEEERDRIAAEMHDDIGSALTTILYLSDDLKTQDKSAALTTADRIASTASSVVDKMNEIIWSMNPDYDNLSDLIAYTRQHCAEFLGDHGLNYDLELPDVKDDVNLSGEQRRNMYLVVKEALHNIVKHASATKVDIGFRVANNSISITIHDNGKGFKQTSSFGNGLNNMRQRTETIGGHFNIKSENGTLIELDCPLYQNGVNKIV